MTKRGTRRTVAGRLLVSYLVVLSAFAITVGWSFQAMREAARDATLVRDAYLPLVSSISEALAGQNVMNVQLNHITAAKNPADIQQWIETARRLRPVTLEQIRRDARRRLPPGSMRRHVIAEASAVERDLLSDGVEFTKLFNALAQGKTAVAERVRDRLVATETDGAKRLRALRARVDQRMSALTEAAQRRERRSIQLLIGLSLLTLLVGLMSSLHTRRVLAPLSVVTERARAVARGDLTERDLVATDDEIGELAKTFEDMVAAIRKARAEVVLTERLATIGKMAVHITHEVRNPLSSISLNLELLEEELAGSGGDEAPQLLAAIQSEVDRLSRIAEQYLAAAREPRLSLQREKIEDLVCDCHAFLLPELERAGVSSRIEVEEGTIPEIDVDEGQLRQALLNLVRNAREALSGNGTVTLRVEHDAEWVRVIVSDDGPGIPDEVRGSIFDPFYTTKQRGTGLGLAVTRAIVEGHGGTIRCQAPSEGGTRFVIELPVPSDDV